MEYWDFEVIQFIIKSRNPDSEKRTGREGFGVLLMRPLNPTGSNVITRRGMMICLRLIYYCRDNTIHDQYLNS